MIPPIPAGAREVDPDAEAARLAAERKRDTVTYLVAEEHQVPAGDHTVRVVINVAASEWHPVPPGFGAKIAAALAENWAARQEPGDG